MKIDTQDLLELRWSLVICAALTLTGAALAWLTWSQFDSATQALVQTQADERSSRSRLDAINSERAEILQRITRYQDLEARGVIGQELRLEWIEQIARIKKERRLIDVQYELAPQKPVDAALLANATLGGFEIMDSAMKLQMPLLTENDLLDFLRDLKAEVKALLLPRRCDVERIKQPPANNALRPQMKADCQIDWITFREKK